MSVTMRIFYKLKLKKDGKIIKNSFKNDSLFCFMIDLESNGQIEDEEKEIWFSQINGTFENRWENKDYTKYLTNYCEELNIEEILISYCEYSILTSYLVFSKGKFIIEESKNQLNGRYIVDETKELDCKEYFKKNFPELSSKYERYFEIEEILCDIDDEEKEEELLEEQQEIIEEVEEKAYKVFCEEFKSYIL